MAEYSRSIKFINVYSTLNQGNVCVPQSWYELICTTLNCFFCFRETLKELCVSTFHFALGSWHFIGKYLVGPTPVGSPLDGVILSRNK